MPYRLHAGLQLAFLEKKLEGIDDSHFLPGFQPASFFHVQ